MSPLEPESLLPASLRSAFFLALLASAACTNGETPPSSGLEAGQHAHLELEAAYPEPFSFLNSVRERSDGSVMAADPLNQVVLRLNMVAGTADTLGRVGEGPQEYLQPDQVFALPGDSTLLVDIGKTQLTVVDPSDTFQSGMKMALVAAGGDFTIIQPRLVDGQGRLYFSGGGGMGQGPRDSLQVSRYDRATGEVELLAMAWRTPPIITRIEGGIRTRQVQMAPRDDWAVGPDGSLAIVRANGYQVEWHLAEGEVVRGLPQDVDLPRLTNEDKRHYLANRNNSGLRVSVFGGDNGAVDVSIARGGGGGGSREEPEPADFEWADAYPPFRPDRARVAPTGELWVERWLPTDRNPEMDVFGEDGVKLGSVSLPVGRELLGWGTTADGATALYLVRTDEFDLMWLERYRVIR